MAPRRASSHAIRTYDKLRIAVPREARDGATLLLGGSPATRIARCNRIRQRIRCGGLGRSEILIKRLAGWRAATARREARHLEHPHAGIERDGDHVAGPNGF